MISKKIKELEMKKVLVFVLGISTGLLYASETQSVGGDIPSITIDESKIPNIDNRSLNNILSTRYSDGRDDTDDIRESFVVGDLSTVKSKYQISDVLKSLEIKHEKLKGANFNAVYLAKDRHKNVFLTNKQYFELLKTIDIYAFVPMFNRYTRLNYSIKKVHSSCSVIYYIGSYADNIVRDTHNVNFVIMSKKNKVVTVSNISSSCENQNAFLYYKNYNTFSNEENIHFDLDIFEVINLYKKLLKWNVKIDYFREELLSMFEEKARYINNFDFESAFADLKSGVTYHVLRDIEKDLRYIKDGKSSSDSESDIKENQTFSSYNLKDGKNYSSLDGEPLTNVLREMLVIEGQKYNIDNKYSNMIIVKNVVTGISGVFTFKDLKRLVAQTTRYRIMVVKNKYVRDANKEVVVFPKRGVSSQALHYLDKAEEEVLIGMDKGFSKKAFIDDVNDIKKGFL